jgi:putative transposase
MLKKLDKTERRLERESNRFKTNKSFELIYETSVKNGYKNTIKYFCELLQVSRSGYYNYVKMKNNRLSRDQSDLKLKQIIEKAFNKRGYKKGARSIKMILENEYGITYSRTRIRRIMRKFILNVRTESRIRIKE